MLDINSIKLIGDINFKDVKVNIYQNLQTNEDTLICAWHMRNPDSYYIGPVFLNFDTNQITYPDGAIIPVQTDKDLEMLPKFIVINKDSLDKNDYESISRYLTSDYNRRNNIN